MTIRIVAAGAAMFAGLIAGTPANAACLPLWGTLCRPAAAPAADTAAATAEAKPHKPLNLGTVAHKNTRRTHVAARHHRRVAAKPAVAKPPGATPMVATQVSPKPVTKRSRVASARHGSRVAARSRAASARRFAALRRRHVAHRDEAAREIPKDPMRDVAKEASRQTGKTPPAATTVASSAPPQTDGYVPSQNEVTELDLAADQPKTALSAAEAPNPALWNAVTPTDPAANAGVDPAADAAKIAAASTLVASADTPHPPEVTASPPQQPAEEPSWLRRIMIGLGGVLTLASAVRLFAG